MKIRSRLSPPFCLYNSAPRAVLCLTVLLYVVFPLRAQTLDRIERGRAQDMLAAIKGDLKKNYYDANFHGVDIDGRFKAADEKLKQAASLGQAFGIIAQALLDLNDSHTFFLPPPRPERIEYGWRMQMIGEKCYVSAVKPGSDAAAKGLKEGDAITSLGGFSPTRRDFWKMQYYYNALSPRPGMKVVAQSPDGQQHQLEIKADVKQGKRVINLADSIDLNELIRGIESDERANRHRYIENLNGVFVWKMPAFDLTEESVDGIMEKVKGRKALILDLRGNGGGAEVTLLHLLGYFFDKNLKVADINSRKESKPLIAKTRGNGHTFSGALVVLVDSDSASSSELFARVIQLEKRGTVIGDHTAGAVMRARHYRHDAGVNTIVPYGVSITDADAIMSDGKSLERSGVTPDEIVLPTSADMLARRDPVMARAAALAGAQLTADKAGALFPIEWR